MPTAPLPRGTEQHRVCTFEIDCSLPKAVGISVIQRTKRNNPYFTYQLLISVDALWHEDVLGFLIGMRKYISCYKSPAQARVPVCMSRGPKKECTIAGRVLSRTLLRSGYTALTDFSAEQGLHDNWAAWRNTIGRERLIDSQSTWYHAQGDYACRSETCCSSPFPGCFSAT